MKSRILTGQPPQILGRPRARALVTCRNSPHEFFNSLLGQAPQAEA